MAESPYCAFNLILNQQYAQYFVSYNTNWAWNCQYVDLFFGLQSSLALHYATRTGTHWTLHPFISTVIYVVASLMSPADGVQVLMAWWTGYYDSKCTEDQPHTGLWSCFVCCFAQGAEISGYLKIKSLFLISRATVAHFHIPLSISAVPHGVHTHTPGWEALLQRAALRKPM